MRNKLNKWAIFWGVIVGIALSAVGGLIIINSSLVDNIENDIIPFLVATCVLFFIMFFSSGLITGLIAGYRANAHGWRTALIIAIISVLCNIIQGYYPTGGIWIVIPIAILFTNIGSIIGVKMHRNKTICPVCLRSTVLKTALKGKNKGKKYYICVNYPECKGKFKA